MIEIRAQQENEFEKNAASERGKIKRCLSKLIWSLLLKYLQQRKNWSIKNDGEYWKRKKVNEYTEWIEQLVYSVQKKSTEINARGEKMIITTQFNVTMKRSKWTEWHSSKEIIIKKMMQRAKDSEREIEER